MLRSQLNKQLSTSIMIVIVYSVIFLLFSLAYKIHIVEFYGEIYLRQYSRSSGYEFNFNLQRAGIGLAIVIFCATILSFYTKKSSHIFLHIHFLLPFIPMIIFYSFGDGNQIYFLGAIISFFIILLVVLFPISIPNIKQISSLAVLSINNAIWLLLIISTLYISIVIYFGGLKFLNFNIWEVYKLRRVAAANLPDIFNYLTPITSKAVVPLLLMLSLYKKNWIGIISACLLSFFIFATAAHKGPLIAPFIIIGAYLVLSSKYRLYLILSAQIIVALGTLYSPLIGDKGHKFGNLTLRRVYIVPAHLNFEYYNFFSENEKVKWSNSKITLGLMDYPYDISVPFIIGKERFNKPDLHANTGWLGMGYAHLGFAGMFIYAIAIGLLIRFTDIVSRRTSLAFSGTLFIIPYLSLFTSSDIPTMFLTHGLLFIFLFIFLLKDKVIPNAKSHSS